MSLLERYAYRDGFTDALEWVRLVFNLDMEDELEIQRVLEGGECEGYKLDE